MHIRIVNQNLNFSIKVTLIGNISGSPWLVCIIVVSQLDSGFSIGIDMFFSTLKFKSVRSFRTSVQTLSIERISNLPIPIDCDGPFTATGFILYVWNEFHPGILVNVTVVF